MKKSEIFVPLSRNRTRKNDRDGFRDVFRTGSGVLYGGGRPGAGCGQETGICKAAEKRRVPKMAFRAPGGRQQPGTDRLVQNPDIPTRRPGRMGGTLPSFIMQWHLVNFWRINTPICMSYMLYGMKDMVKALMICILTVIPMMLFTQIGIAYIACKRSWIFRCGKL